MSYIHACSAACGIIDQGAVSPNPHYNTPTGTPTRIANPWRSGFAFQYVSGAGAEVSHRKSFIPAQAIVPIHFSTYFPTSLPGANLVLAAFSSGGTFDIVIWFHAATGRLRIGTEGLVNSAEVATNLAADTKYSVEALINISANPWTYRLSVDEVEVNTSVATTLSTFSFMKIGANCIGYSNAVYSPIISDIIIGNAALDYPIGPHKVIHISPAGDGTHNFSTNGDFLRNNTIGINAGDTTTFQSVDDSPLTSTSDFIAAGAGVEAGEYLEWTPSAISETENALVVCSVSTHRAASVATNSQALRIYDGSNFTNVIDDVDFGDTTQDSYSAIIAAPGGGAWTPALFGSIVWRWGTSWDSPDVSPVPFLDGVMLEAAFPEDAGTPPGATIPVFIRTYRNRRAA